MLQKVLYFIIVAAVMPSSVAQAAEPLSISKPNHCELHIWPTKTYLSTAVKVKVGYAGPGYFSVGTYLEPINDVDQVLSRNLTELNQVEIVKSVTAHTGTKFTNYEVIVHPAPDGSRHGNWTMKEAGYGERDSHSVSQCYSELHILFLMYFTNTTGGKIQTTLLYRDFGRKTSTTKVAKGIMNYKAGSFPARTSALTITAEGDAKEAFAKGITKFLNKKSVGKI